MPTLVGGAQLLVIRDDSMLETAKRYPRASCFSGYYSISAAQTLTDSAKDALGQSATLRT